ncbi:MAG: glucokinase [Ignavibacteria bacterium]
MILAGDAGATKTELAVLLSLSKRRFKIISHEIFPTNKFSSIEEILQLFLGKYDHKIDSACIGVAGPVLNRAVISTNSALDADEESLSRRFKIKKFKLVNDLEPAAATIPLLEPKDLITVYKGKKADTRGTKILISPGTGLGQAALIYSEGKFVTVATEGGHCDYAPNDEIEIELLKYLRRQFSHVSFERVASGIGIVNIFNFLVEIKYSKVSGNIFNRMKHEDAAAVISGEGMKGNCRLCVKVIEIFASSVGAQTGNMVLNYNATGGVYLGGGIPMKIPGLFKSKTFLTSYLNKGRMKLMIEKNPVHIIKDTATNIYGAGLIALTL